MHVYRWQRLTVHTVHSSNTSRNEYVEGNKYIKCYHTKKSVCNYYFPLLVRCGLIHSYKRHLKMLCVKFGWNKPNGHDEKWCISNILALINQSPHETNIRNLINRTWIIFSQFKFRFCCSVENWSSGYREELKKLSMYFRYFAIICLYGGNWALFTHGCLLILVEMGCIDFWKWHGRSFFSQKTV